MLIPLTAVVCSITQVSLECAAAPPCSPFKPNYDSAELTEGFWDQFARLFVLAFAVIVATQQKRAAFASLHFICGMT